ncbi:bile acid:sodium symporter family protein [Aquibium sp. A9E412]|uniref:bile acid:sodium symporter family protein n=1 Tax=Aquibium sp. A9E412 TaxID=2976767 RepID=UPI0025B1CEC3|nr:bile acid:sodium symporter family protein [Aquibium sp. A9E412]MDN2567888.1 bile acid:sodium symporter family protein [Aquibium sp. A9E412]
MGFAITLFVPLALAVMMFSLGLGLAVGDFVRVARHPRAFAVGLFAQFVLLPAVGFAICHLFALAPEMAVGLMILALSPGGVTSNMMTRYCDGDVALSISLNGVSNLAAVFTMPLLVAVFADYFLGLDSPDIAVANLGLTMFALTAAPVAAGLLVRRYAQPLAEAIDAPVRKAAMILLVVVIAGAVASNWQSFMHHLPSLGPSIVLLAVTLLVAGLLLARLAALGPPQATAIALDTGIQNAAFGITVGAVIGGGEGLVPAYSVPSGVYGVLMYLVIVPFMFWRRAALLPALHGR